ncbi:MAG: outer membrane beta-barrel protein [Bacteroidota bacterium]
MKTKVLTFILLLNILFSYGQVIGNIGIKAGVSLANMTDKYKIQSIDITDKYDYKAGIYSALTAEFFKGKFLSLAADIGFVQKGMQRKTEITTAQLPEGTGEYTTWKYSRNCVTFSPMLKGFYTSNKLTAYALAGPRIDVDFTYALPPESSMNSKTHRLIFGFSYGVGAEYKIKKIGFLLECMGQPDITLLVSQQPEDSNFSLKARGNAYIVTTGLKLYLH